MNRILEQISWMPFDFLTSIKRSKKNFINLDLKNVGIKRVFKFHLSPKDKGLSSQLISFGFREPLNLKYHYDFINSSDVVLDIGANIGLFSILSENAKKIICVEPLKEAIPILKKNIKGNSLSKKTKILNAAVGKKGKLLIEVDEKLNLSKVVEKSNKNTYKVKSFGLSELVNEYNANVVRMDVEGYEYEILHKKIPKKVNKISIEFHTALLGDKKTKELINYFKKEGFKASYLIEDLPIRLYPFWNLLKKTKIIKKIVYAKKNLTMEECLKFINKGREVKYLFIER